MRRLPQGLGGVPRSARYCGQKPKVATGSVQRVQGRIAEGPAHSGDRRRHRPRQGDGRRVSRSSAPRSSSAAGASRCATRPRSNWWTSTAGRSTSYGVDIRDAAARRRDGRGDLPHRAADRPGQQRRRQFHLAHARTCRRKGFDAVANIVMHGTFYVTHAVGRRWIAGKHKGSVGLDRGDLGRQRRPVRRAVGDEQGGDPTMTRSLAVEWGPLRHPPQRDRARRVPDRRRGQAAAAGRGAGRAPPQGQSDGPPRADGGAAEPRHLPARAGLRLAHRRDHHGRRRPGAGAAGGFYDLREWSDEQWRAAREAIQAQNAKDRAARSS